MKRYIFLIPLFVITVVLGRYFFLTSQTSAYQSVAAERGAISQKVLASGHVESPTDTELHFKASGKLTLLKARTGMKVTAGMVLAREDAGILSAQLSAAKAGVAAANAALSKLRSGATRETIALSQSSVALADQTLANKYASVASTLSDAYAKANDSIVNQLAPLFTNAQTSNPKLTFQLSDSATEASITANLFSVNGTLATWQRENATLPADASQYAFDDSLTKASAHLEEIRLFLTQTISAIAANVGLSSSAATTYRANASAGLNEVNAATAEIKSIEQSISSGKAGLAQAKAGLDLTNAAAPQDDVSAQLAVVREGEANVAAIEAQMRDLDLVAPFAGTVTDTEGTVGSVVTPASAVVSLIPESELDIKVNVAEGNIVNVKAGNPVTIQLDAFPLGTEFSGVVSDIDPAETVIGGAIYYRTTVNFMQKYSDLRPGMTANVRIETGSSSDVLLIPASALTISSTSTRVRVLNGRSNEVREVTTGLQSQDGMVEILSGLSGGERVIIGSN